MRFLLIFSSQNYPPGFCHHLKDRAKLLIPPSEAALREKYRNTEFFSGPNTGKYGTEKTPYLDTSPAVLPFLKIYLSPHVKGKG